MHVVFDVFELIERDKFQFRLWLIFLFEKLHACAEVIEENIGLGARFGLFVGSFHVMLFRE
jgi:hypothetical protein